LMVITIPFADKLGHGGKAEILGYTTIVLSALLIFFGVRSYRQNVAGGRLSFGRAFAVGILIALISSAVYVTSWEILSRTAYPDFADKYAAQMIDHAKQSGGGQAAIDKATEQAAQFKEMYANPVMRVALTFLEPFPVGLVVTLLSAAILRKKSPSVETQPA
jgi:Protein of unknown function (DUF4199)